MGTHSHLQSKLKSTTASSTDGSSASVVSRSSFLAFKLGREEYGIPIHSVQEIHAYVTPRQIANSPNHVAGVMDLNGAIAPAVDLRRMLGAPPPRHPLPPAVIAVRIGPDLVGIIVDSVTGVVELTPEQLLPVPKPNHAAEAELLIAIGAIDERFMILIDLAKILGSADLGLKRGVFH